MFTFPAIYISHETHIWFCMDKLHLLLFFSALSSRRLFFYSIFFYLPVYIAALFSSRKLADREFLSSTETKLEFVTRDWFFFRTILSLVLSFYLTKDSPWKSAGIEKNTPSSFVVCVFLKKNSLSSLTSAQIAAVKQKKNFSAEKKQKEHCLYCQYGRKQCRLFDHLKLFESQFHFQH